MWVCITQQNSSRKIFSHYISFFSEHNPLHYPAIIPNKMAVTLSTREKILDYGMYMTMMSMILDYLFMDKPTTLIVKSFGNSK